MGDFTITCELAQSLVGTYGLEEPEVTTIINSQYESFPPGRRMSPETRMVPILDIRGEEIDEWMNFTSSFKPWKRAR